MRCRRQKPPPRKSLLLFKQYKIKNNVKNENPLYGEPDFMPLTLASAGSRLSLVASYTGLPTQIKFIVARNFYILL